MGALALLLKRVQQLLGIFQFALLFFDDPTETWVGPLHVLALLLPMTRCGAAPLVDGTRSGS